jgi:NADH-quinone oxidoreductase subunit C/D
VNSIEKLKSDFKDDLEFDKNNSAILKQLDSEFLFSTLKKLKNNYGFIMLLDIIGQDLRKTDEVIENDKFFQVSYILLNMELHLRLKVNVRVDLSKSEVLPSVDSLWSSSSWCEREAYEMYGISFGENSKKSLLTDNNTNHFPFRKDYVNSEEETIIEKPLNPFSTLNISEKFKVNLIDQYSIGPIHPGLKGAMKLHLQVEGEQVIQSQLEFGFLHRAIEKSCETKRYSQILPLSDRLNYFSSAANNVGWAKAVEDLISLEVSDRSKAVRMVICELARINDHAQCIGSMAQGTRVLEPLEVTYKIRELIFNLFEQLCGARVTNCLTRIGGMSTELPMGWSNDCLIQLKQLSGYIEEINSYLTKSSYWVSRLETTALNAYEAIGWGITGPNLRACGVNYDIRKVSPYYFYEDVEFEVPLGINGDCYDRYLVRLEEMRQSIKIITQVLDSLPPGKTMAENLNIDMDLSLLNFKPAKGEVYSMTESPNGELGFYINSLGDVCPYRVKIRPPSFFSAQAFSSMLNGTNANDAMLSLCSMNIVASEVDR